MDISTFYAITAGACFTLVGLWWSVVHDKEQWFRDEITRNLAGGVYASFLLPALMSMGAQIGGTSQPFLWQTVFVLAGGLGIHYSTRLMQRTRAADLYGPFSKNRWVIPVLYGIVIVVALFPGLTRLLGLQLLQAEALLLTMLILIAHMLTWEFMASTLKT